MSDGEPLPLCRFCRQPLEQPFVDLGLSPLCQTLVTPDQVDHGEMFYPLKPLVCGTCFLVQLEEFVTPDEIFSNYPYFSSYSESWVEHMRDYAKGMTHRLSLDDSSFVVEIASNDGYLLQHFRRLGVPVLGIEPASNVAKVAIERGIPSEVRFFGNETGRHVARSYGKPDLLIGNNVLAHVPNINDFMSGMKALLGEAGRITMEFPHLMELMDKNQFDTIYHEHFSYLSLSTTVKIFEHHGLQVFDVERLPTHGGSLRIHATHVERGLQPEESVCAILQEETRFGLADLNRYAAFADQVAETKRQIMTFLIQEKRHGKQIAGYGAPGKGNTLLNYCGIRADFLSFTVDRSPHKHGNYTPGTRIPIYHPDKIRELKPDYLFILPWNLVDEIVASTAYIREWGGKWVIPIPRVTIIE